MRKRFKMKGRPARKLFTKTAMMTHKRNQTGNPMRGGYRL